MGQDTLAGWLSAPDELEVIRARQQLVRDLAQSLDLREALASLDADLGQVKSDVLVRWADAAPLASVGRVAWAGNDLHLGLDLIVRRGADRRRRLVAGRNRLLDSRGRLLSGTPASCW